MTHADYDAPLAENGDVTAKYRAIRKAVLKHKRKEGSTDGASDEYV